MKKSIKTSGLLIILALLLATTAFANNTKLVALTFDDGPHGKYTPMLLDRLAEKNLHCTFFQVGQNVARFPEIVQRVHDEGHQLASHSYTHMWCSKTTAAVLKNEISKTNELLKTADGQDFHMFRAPYGDVTSNAKKLAGAPLIQWSVDPTNGYVNLGEAVMYANMMNTVRDGSIILLHDSNQKNINVAFKSIDALSAQGYTFVTVEELFRLRGETPAAGCLYFSVPQTAKETQFDETKLSTHWAADYINLVSENKLMQGSELGFQPNGYMTRSMAATILWRLSGSPSSQGKALPVAGEAPPSGADPASMPPMISPAHHFLDVTPNTWYSDAVTWCFENNYISGVSSTSFAPEACVTKEQFYAMLARYGQSTLATAPWAADIAVYSDDCRISDYARDSVQAFRNSGFKSKNDPQIFRPLDFITRAETAELVSWIIRDCPMS